MAASLQSGNKSAKRITLWKIKVNNGAVKKQKVVWPYADATHFILVQLRSNRDLNMSLINTLDDG